MEIGNKVTMQDVADRVGVSKVTVSKALRGSTEISEAMRQKILEASNEIGYEYNPQSSTSGRDLTLNIGIITADRYFGQEDFFYVELYRLLSKQLEEQGFNSIFHILDSKSEKEVIIPAMISENRIDGVIILGQLSKEYLNRTLGYKLPILFLDFYCDRIDKDVDSVVTDNFFGAYGITNTLIEEGHKKIGYVGNVNLTSSIQDRFLGYYKSILEYRLEFRNDWIIRDRNDDNEWIEIEIPKEMPTAFVCNCDKTAFMLMEKLKSCGYEIPDDCSVVGFDDSVHSRSSEPQITTVRVDIENMVKTAAKIIAKKIRNREKRYGRVLIKGNVIKRESTREVL